jgi:tetratricopeptide (TPR) repeat protein
MPRVAASLITVTVTALSLALLAPPAAAEDLSGRWELQSLGADRELKLVQRGNKLMAYRVMWPEFEGKRYKLEHLYRGRIKGKALRGKLMVKEPELPRFEKLRSFKGKLTSSKAIILDGMPLRRLSTAPPTPRISVAVDKVGSLSSPSLELERLTDEGDRHLARKEYSKALSKYRAASRNRRYGTPASLLHRLGRCYLELKNLRSARRYLSRALRLDPLNKALKLDYDRARKG